MATEPPVRKTLAEDLVRTWCESGRTHHLCGGFGVLRGDVVLEGGLGEAHLPTVGTGEGLRLLH